MTVERRVYTKEFKEQVVMLIETSGKSVGEIAKDLGIRENNLWSWRKEFCEAPALTASQAMATVDRELIWKKKTAVSKKNF